MAQEWYYTENGDKQGPVSSKQLKLLVANGKLQSSDLVWVDGMNSWKPASEIKGLVPQSSSAVPPSLTPDGGSSGGSRWTKKRIAAAFFVFIVMFSGAVRGCNQVGGGVGTVTFAEEIDADTLETTNEGTQFSTGWVWWVVRCPEPFGDTTVITYAREHGSVAWSVIGRETVDPSWDTYVSMELLDSTGSFDIKVVTAKGKFIAQGTVDITN